MSIKKNNLTKKIFIAFLSGIIVGIIINLLKDIAPTISNLVTENILNIGGEIFLKALKMLVVPIVFCSIICGVCGLKDFSSLGRISLKTVCLYIFTTSIAISLALIVSSLIQPGMTEESNFTNERFNLPDDPPPLNQILLNIIPTNPFKALADGNMLQIIFFSIILGAAISLSGNKANATQSFFISLNEVILRSLELLMIIAPIGIFCLISKTFATQGFDIILELAKYFFTVVLVLMLHMFFVYGSLVKFIGNRSILNFFKNIRECMFFAFSTSSSSATIPVTLKNVEQNLGVEKKISSFTVPLGSTINMDGTAIMQGVATVFIANIYNQVLSLEDFLTVILTATLASIGTAGVPGVGLIMLGMVLNQVGLPLEGIAMVMGVDRFLDMLRTSVNVSGDAAVSLVIDKSENNN